MTAEVLPINYPGSSSTPVATTTTVVLGQTAARIAYPAFGDPR